MRDVLHPMDPASAFALITIGGLLDIWSLWLNLAIVRKGRGRSGTGPIAWLLYVIATLLSVEPIPLAGTPSWLFRAVSLLELTAFHVACQYAVPVVLREFFNGRHAIHRAARSGSLQRVTSLLAGGAEVMAADNLGWTPLHIAASRGNVAVVDVLLRNGADPNLQTEDCSTPLGLAAFRGYTEVARTLLEHGAIVNPELPDLKEWVRDLQ